MKYRPKYSDFRLSTYCIYCGRTPDSMEHTPSKALLDEPYPENLPTVPVCKICNNGFSLNEEYTSCIIECARCGSTRLEKLIRNKVKRTMEHKIKLHASIKSNIQLSLTDRMSIAIKKPRIKDVMIKICQGHAAYELSETTLKNPSKILIKPIFQMSYKERIEFESEIKNTLLPEIGSRATFSIDNSVNSNWMIVQKGRYRYMTGIAGGIIVKVVISEYLACEVVWAENGSEEDIPEFWMMPKVHPKF